MALFHDSAIVGASGNQGGAGGYQISRSLRFNSADSAYLSRTPASAGNRKTWTWSGWVKRSGLGDKVFFSAYTGSGSTDNSYFAIRFISSDQLHAGGYSTVYRVSTAVFRDASAWYHIVCAVDTTQATATDRIKLWVNGSQITTFSTENNPTQNADLGINQAAGHTIGREAGFASYYDGYLADIHFIDGQALTPSSFAETNATTGQWVPKAYTGSYGTNGFQLKFADNSAATAATLGKDTSGNGNNWTPTNFSVTSGSLNYPTSTITGSAGLTGQANVFDGNLSTSATVSLSSDNYILFTPTTGISYTTSVRFYAYAANGYLITNYYSLNGGAETTFVGGTAGFNGAAWITAATGSGTLTSLKVRLTRGNAESSAVNLYAIEVDGVILVNSSNNDSLVDTPTSYGTGNSGGDVRGNYCTWNPLDKNTSFSAANGNLDASATVNGNIRGTLGVSSGKWYWEYLINNTNPIVGIANAAATLADFPGIDANGYGYYSSNGNKFNNSGTGSSYGATYTTGDIIGVALDLDAGTLVFYKNGVSQGTAFSGIPTGTYFPAAGRGNGTFDVTLNAGARPFAYTAPSGFKALCDTNLPAPVVAKPNTVMDVALYTGNGSTQTISGLGFSSDLIWIKRRDGSGQDHVLQDSVRGFTSTTKLASSSTSQENAGTNSVTDPKWGYVTGSSSTGFDITASTSGDQVNKNAWSYAAWCWDAGSSTVTNTSGTISSQVRANASAGFSVVVYTGAGGTQTVGHGLGVKPSLIIIKRRDVTSNWLVYHASVGATKYLYLNATDASASWSGFWGNTEPTSSVFTLGGDGAVNNSGSSHVAYCFAPVAGYSSFGSYTGNGSSDGPFVYTGFKPAWLLIKRTDSTSDWILQDNKRLGYNVDNNDLIPNQSYAEATDDRLDQLSNGFKLRSTFATSNASGGTYIYAAFAESPFQYARAR